MGERIMIEQAAWINLIADRNRLYTALKEIEKLVLSFEHLSEASFTMRDIRRILEEYKKEIDGTDT